MKIIYIRVTWNIILSIAMIVISINMFMRTDSIIITYLSGFDLVKHILKYVGFIPTAVLLCLLGLSLLYDAIKAFKIIRNDEEI